MKAIHQPRAGLAWREGPYQVSPQQTLAPYTACTEGSDLRVFLWGNGFFETISLVGSRQHWHLLDTREAKAIQQPKALKVALSSYQGSQEPGIFWVPFSSLAMTPCKAFLSLSFPICSACLFGRLWSSRDVCKSLQDWLYKRERAIHWLVLWHAFVAVFLEMHLSRIC